MPKLFFVNSCFNIVELSNTPETNREKKGVDPDLKLQEQFGVCTVCSDIPVSMFSSSTVYDFPCSLMSYKIKMFLSESCL